MPVKSLHSPETNSRSFSSLASPEAPTYEYQRLQAQRSIRLLEILPDKRGAPLRCNIFEASLDNAPAYEALSYFWGPADFVKRLFCGTEIIYITRNCSYALHHLRYATEPRILWVDACCIDQKADGERNHQVGMMGDVYRNAKCVLVWLGKAENWKQRSDGRWMSSDAWALAYAGGAGRDRSTWRGHFSNDFRHLFNKPWFHRVWTVQEFALARECTVMCGEASIEASDLMVFLSSRRIQPVVEAKFDRILLHQQMWQDVRRTRDSRDENFKPVDCTRLLLGVRKQDSSNPKDKIFAFQGLLDLLGAHLPAPDYSKPVSQIYREAAAYAIRHDFSLLLLSSLTGESSVTGLPSWVPDWSNKDAISEIDSWNEERCKALSPASIEISWDITLLTLHGTIIDTIDCVSLNYPQSDLLLDIEGEHVSSPALRMEIEVLKQWISTFSEVESGSDVAKFFSELTLDAWTRTHDIACLMDGIVARQWVQAFKSDQVRKNARWDLWKFSCSWATWFRFEGNKKQLEKVRDNIVSFHLTVRKSLDRKSMFRSQKGKLGIGCRSLQKGDSIALFAGCGLLMIIRQDGPYWRFISPVYLPETKHEAQWAETVRTFTFA